MQAEGDVGVVGVEGISQDMSAVVKVVTADARRDRSDREGMRQRRAGAPCIGAGCYIDRRWRCAVDREDGCWLAGVVPEEALDMALRARIWCNALRTLCARLACAQGNGRPHQAPAAGPGPTTSCVPPHAQRRSGSD